MYGITAEYFGIDRVYVVEENLMGGAGSWIVAIYRYRQDAENRVQSLVDDTTKDNDTDLRYKVSVWSLRQKC